MNLYCADSGSKRTSTALTLVPNESLLRWLWLQRTSTVQTRAPNESLKTGRVGMVDWVCWSLGRSFIPWLHLTTLLRRLGLQTNLYCADSGFKRTSAQTRLQTNLYCADSGSKRTATAQTLAPNEPLLCRLGLQTNLYCADSGSKRISTAQTLAPNESLLCWLWLQRTSTVQTRAPNESLLRRLGLQTNLYCADSGCKRISTAQTLAPNKSILCRLWLQMSLFSQHGNGHAEMYLLHFSIVEGSRDASSIFFSLCSKPLWSKWYSNLFSFQNSFKYHLLCSTEENEVKMIWWSTPLKLWPSHTNDFCWGVGLILRDSVVGPRCTLSLAVKF